MSEDDDELARREAAHRELDEKNFWVIIMQLKDENSTFRWKAAESLGRICDPRAVEPLIGYLHDSDRWVRQGVPPGRWARSVIAGRSIQLFSY